MNNLKKPFPKKRLLILACIFIPLIALLIYSWGAISLWVPAIFGSNPAQEIALPLEKALIAKGAVKKCSTGSNGLGPDNAEPWYSSFYQFNKDKTSAINILHRVAKEQGYSLADSESTYDSIEHFNDLGKNHSFSDIKEGKIELRMSIYSDTAKKPLGCYGGPELIGDETHTGVTLSVGLPMRIGY